MGALPPPEATKAYAIGTRPSNRPSRQLGQFGQAGQTSAGASGGALRYVTKGVASAAGGSGSVSVAIPAITATSIGTEVSEVSTATASR